MADDLTKESAPVSMLDPYQIWKRMYFAFEESLTTSVRNSVTTDNFASGIDLILNSYLQYLKLRNDYIARYVEDSPFSSKRDVARVAELVVSLENKVDILENELDEKLEDICAQTGQLCGQMTAQPDTLTETDFNKVFTPALAAVKDLGKRVSDLEKIVKKVDSNLTAMNKMLTAESKKQVPKPPVTKPTPPTETV